MFLRNVGGYGARFPKGRQMVCAEGRAQRDTPCDMTVMTKYVVNIATFHLSIEATKLSHLNQHTKMVVEEVNRPTLDSTDRNLDLKSAGVQYPNVNLDLERLISSVIAELDRLVM